MVHYDICQNSHHNEPLSCMGAKASQPTIPEISINCTRMFTHQFNDVANDSTILYASNTCMQLYMCTRVPKALNTNTNILINIIT